MRVQTIIERLDSSFFFLSFHRMGTMELGGTNTGCGMPWTYTRTRGFLCLYYNSIFDSV